MGGSAERRLEWGIGQGLAGWFGGEGWDRDMAAGGGAFVHAVAGRSVAGLRNGARRAKRGLALEPRRGHEPRVRHRYVQVRFPQRPPEPRQRFVAGAVLPRPELQERELRRVVDRRRPGGAGTQSARSATCATVRPGGTASTASAARAAPFPVPFGSGAIARMEAPVPAG